MKPLKRTWDEKCGVEDWNIAPPYSSVGLARLGAFSQGKANTEQIKIQMQITCSRHLFHKQLLPACTYKNTLFLREVIITKFNCCTYATHISHFNNCKKGLFIPKESEERVIMTETFKSSTYIYYY